MKNLQFALYLLFLMVLSKNALAYGPPNYLPDGAHPRIFLTPSVINELKAKAATNDSDWLELKAKADALLAKTVIPYQTEWGADNQIFYSYEGSTWWDSALPLGIAYQVTGNKAYAAKLKELVVVINNAGNAPIIVDVGFPTRFVAGVMALSYDWLYDYLDATTKANMITTINNWHTMISTGSNGLYIPLNGNNNYFGGYILGMGLCGIATYGDNPTAPAINSLISGWWDNYAVQAFTGAAAGGQILESYNYGPNHIIRLLEYALAIKTATGADLYSTYSDKLIRSMFYNLKPNRWQSTNEGDMAGDYSGVMGMNLSIFLSSIDTSIQGDKAAYFYSHMARPSISGAESVQPATVYERTLFKNSRTQLDYRTTDPTYYRSSGDDHLFVRSDWTDNAVWAAFSGGSVKATDHQTRAAGHIELARGNDSLLVNVNQWKGDTGVSGQPQQMTSISSMTNTLFTNGAANAYGGIDYLGGQGAWGTLNNVLKYETGSGYSYMKTDLSTAYNLNDFTHADVPYFHRNFVYLGGGTFVLYDRVRMRTTSLVKEFRFHLHKQSTNTNTAGLSKSVLGSSALFIKSIYPTTTLMVLTTADNTAVNPVIKLTDTVTSTDFNPLTVLIADASSASMPSTTGIDTTSMQGVLISLSTPKVIMFAKDETQQNTVTYTAAYSAGTTGNHLLVDMESATYDIYRDGSKIITGAVASPQGVLSFSSTGGTQFQIVQTGQAPKVSPPKNLIVR